MLVRVRSCLERELPNPRYLIMLAIMGCSAYRGTQRIGTWLFVVNVRDRIGGLITTGIKHALERV